MDFLCQADRSALARWRLSAVKSGHRSFDPGYGQDPEPRTATMAQSFWTYRPQTGTIPSQPR